MKCAFVASYYGPYYSNFIASMLAFHDGMTTNGHEVCYVFPKEAESFEWLPLLKKRTNKIYFIGYHGLAWKDICSLRKIFKLENVDLIYSHMCGWDFSAHFAAPFTPIVWHMRMGVNLKPFAKMVKNWIKFHILGFGKTYHVAVSDAVTDIINSLRPRHLCQSIPNALETSRLPSSFVVPFKEKPYRLLMFGWQPTTKGLDTVLDASEKLNLNEKIIELVVSAQEKTYEYIRKRYQDSPPEWLKLLPPTSNVASVYSQGDMMVSASRSEGFSFCLAEALYCGLPVIYSDIPGTSWAGEFQCTHVFKMADSVDLCRAIHECIKQGLTEKEQVTNRKLLEKKYSMSAWTSKIIEYLETIVKK